MIVVKELKISIDDILKTERQIVSKGAIYTDDVNSEYTYFNQPAGKVLKISKNGQDYYLVVIEKRKNRFKIIEYKQIEDNKKVLRELLAEFGLKKKVYNQQKIYKYKNLTITINKIKDVGNFLILIGENPTVQDLTELGFDNPKIVKESFDNI